ncbi:transcription repressor OFP12-like [Curcuma longa]|uniref:transcription repressor OFP12-like n=1 Tax=Curcuma longa TaxID=136217 RepID=UPI003D9F7560
MLGESLYGCFSSRRRASHSAAALPDCPDGSSGRLFDSTDVSSSSEREISSAIASRRLLLASPGRSNSLVDSSSVALRAGDAVAVATYSTDPYCDFRRSMEEMVAALGLDAGAAPHLHELLLCYLALNRKHVHKHILRAFADVLLALTGDAD